LSSSSLRTSAPSPSPWQAVRYRPTTDAEVHTMTSGTSGQRRPELGEVLREATTPDDLLRMVRARLTGIRQREQRAAATTAAVIRERLPDLAAQTIAEAD